MSVKSFLAAVPDVVMAEYKKRKGDAVFPSVCIAQSALESGWNENAKTLFGIKGTGTTMTTQEYVNGQMVTVQASFKNYATVAAAVEGYYDLMSKSRYVKAKSLQTPEAQIDYIATAGYATDPEYASKVKRIIKKYDLTQYDIITESTVTDLEAVALAVIRGDYGNGSERMRRLTNAGYNYREVQDLVNKMLA